MSNIALNTYETWYSFKTSLIQGLFDNNPFNRGKYLFRGQANPDWKLVSSFDRIFRDKSDSEKLLKYFVEEGLKYELIKENHKEENYYNLALGQHYGLPTRLLDWTESPYFAAFFAYTGASSNEDRKDYVSIWVLNIVPEIFSFERGLEIIDPPKIDNFRLRNQYGRFTHLTSSFDSLDDHIQSLNIEDDSPILIKCLIPSSDIKHALSDLDVMGINYIRAYSDLSGIALNARTKTLYGFC